MKDYWKTIEATIRRFTQPGDALRCVSMYRVERGTTCELCGHVPIKHVYVLANDRTKEELQVGRKCIVQYKKVFEEIYRSTAVVVFPATYFEHADKINDRFPGTIIIERFDPRTVDVTTDPPTLVRYAEDSSLDSEEFEEYFPEGMGWDEMDWESMDFEDD